MEIDTSWFQLNRNGSPLYQQLVDLIVCAVEAGALAAGTRLPAERDLARSLGVSRTTATTAYAELAARGIVRRQVGRGTYVAAREDEHDAPFAWRGKVALSALRTEDPALKRMVAASTQPGLISFSAAIPAPECFPDEVIAEMTARLMRRRPGRISGLAPTEGLPELRETIARRYGVSIEQTLILNGAQQGLDLISRCLIDPGDVVVMDRPGYIGAIQTFRAAGAHLVGWDFGAADLEALEDLLIRYRPKFVYTTPTFQNPTGQTMPGIVRREFLDVAARYRVPVVEDDPYRELSFDANVPRSMRELDEHQLVIQIGTVSKTIAGGLRLGWLIANPTIVEQLSLVKQRSDVATPSLQQLLISEFLASGEFDRHLTRIRGEHARRYAAVISSIGRWMQHGAFTYAPVTGGMYLWCQYRGGRDAVDLLADAHAVDVVFLNGEACYPDAGGRRHLRLCFTGVTPERIDIGVRRLAGLLREQ